MLGHERAQFRYEKNSSMRLLISNNKHFFFYKEIIIMNFNFFIVIFRSSFWKIEEEYATENKTKEAWTHESVPSSSMSSSTQANSSQSTMISQEEEEENGEKKQDKQEPKKDAKKKKIKKKLRLPWCFKIVGYIFAGITIVACVMFIIFKGISLGDATVQKWLTSFLVSALASILFTQPLKVDS